MLFLGANSMTWISLFVNQLAPIFHTWLLVLLGQWLNFKLFGITHLAYLVGKIKFKLFFQGPLVLRSVRCVIKFLPNVTYLVALDLFGFLTGDFFRIVSHGMKITIIKTHHLGEDLLVNEFSIRIGTAVRRKSKISA